MEKVQIEVEVKTIETIEVSLPRYYRYRVNKNVEIFGRITEHCTHEILKRYADRAVYEISERPSKPQDVAGFFGPEFDCSENDYAKVWREALDRVADAYNTPDPVLVFSSE